MRVQECDCATARSVALVLDEPHRLSGRSTRRVVVPLAGHKVVGPQTMELLANSLLREERHATQRRKRISETATGHIRGIVRNGRACVLQQATQRRRRCVRGNAIGKLTAVLVIEAIRMRALGSAPGAMSNLPSVHRLTISTPQSGHDDGASNLVVARTRAPSCDLGRGRQEEPQRRWAANTQTVNAFRMTPETMLALIASLNRRPPRRLLAYAQAAFELAAFAEREAVEVRP